MNRIFTKYMLLIFLGFSLTNCLKSELEDTNIENENNIFETINIPDNFDFSTTKDVYIELKAPAFLSGAVFDIYYSIRMDENLKIATGTFDKNNTFSALISLPSYIDSLEIVSRYFGLEKHVIVPIEGLKAVYDYNIYYPETNTEKSEETGLKSAFVAGFSYMGGYTANRLPELFI